MTPGEASALNLGSGLIAGFAAAIISQPADTLLSKINKTKALPGETVTGRLVKMSGQLGVSGLFTGLGARYVLTHVFRNEFFRSFYQFCFLALAVWSWLVLLLLVNVSIIIKSLVECVCSSCVFPLCAQSRFSARSSACWVPLAGSRLPRFKLPRLPT